MSKRAEIHGHIDVPSARARVYDQMIVVSGWAYAAGEEPDHCVVRSYIDDQLCGDTATLSYRSDVCEHLGVSGRVPTAFRVLGKLSQPITEPKLSTLRVTMSWSGKDEVQIGERRVQVLPAVLHERAHGTVVSPDIESVLHREHIYGSGPPAEQASPELADLVLAYLPQRARVVDVGCGAGAYASALIAAGHEWLGLEASAACCEILVRRSLPFRRVDPAAQLRCADDEWDCAICIEVLEHVASPEAFVAEIGRITRGRALFSVPNIEVLPYMHGVGVAPWHMLEADHKNFFTRTSLRRVLEKVFGRVEVICYGEQPVRSREGIPLYAHLLSIADRA